VTDDPKRLLDDPEMADPDLAARLRSDLRIAKDTPPAYDVEGGLARLSAAIAGGPAGGGHDGGGSGPGTHADGSAAGSLAGSGAATTGTALGVKAGLAGLVALGALGAALVVGSATRTPSSTASPASSASAAAATAPPIAFPAPVASPPPPAEAPPPEAPARAAEPQGARSSASSAAAGPRGSASAGPAAGATVKVEMDQYIEARNALGSDPGRALALAEEGHARFPRGVFWQEREALAIGALVKLGRAAEAKPRARAFVERHPESPFAGGLRTLAGGE
jgi:hypothetical protein